MKKAALFEVPRAVAIAFALIASVAISSAQPLDASDYNDDPQADDGSSEPDDDPAPGHHRRDAPDYAPRPSAQGAFSGRHGPYERYGPRDAEDADDPPVVVPHSYKTLPVERQELPPPVTRLAPIPTVSHPPDAGAPRLQSKRDAGRKVETYREAPARPAQLRVHPPPVQRDLIQPDKYHAPATARALPARNGLPTRSATTASKAPPETLKKQGSAPVQASVTKTPAPTPSTMSEPSLHRQQREAQTRDNAAAPAATRSAGAEIVNKAEPKLNLEKQ